MAGRRTKRSVVLACLATGTIAAPAPAHADETIHAAQFWGGIQVSHKLTDRLIAVMEIQPRFTTRNAATAPLTIIPPVLAFSVNKNLTLAGGYIYIVIEAPNDVRFTERRAFQQASYSLFSVGKLTVRGQTRLEQRWRSTAPGTNLRVANQVLASLPLTDKDAGIAAVVSFEPYINLDSAAWGARTGFDSLWSFAGVALPVGKQISFDLGYLNQLARRVNGIQAMNHAAVVGVSFRL